VRTDRDEALAWLMRVHDAEASATRLRIVREGLERAERAIHEVQALAEKWQDEAQVARSHGTPDPKSSKRAHVLALRRILDKWEVGA
jgi:hypothetical protein